MEVPVIIEPVVGSGYRVTGAGGDAAWKQDAGYLADDPLYQPWRDAMQEYRRELDEDPEAL